MLLQLTATLGWQARRAKITCELSDVVSAIDPDLLYFQRLHHIFSEDGNVLVVSLADARVYQLPGFVALSQLSQGLAGPPGMVHVHAARAAEKLGTRAVGSPAQEPGVRAGARRTATIA